MKKIFLFSILLASVIYPLSLAKIVSADGTPVNYTPLVPISGITTNTNGTSTDLGVYISGLYKLVIGLAIVLAVIMFTFHGAQYLGSAANISKISDAKNGMKNVVIGLLLILCAWLILNTINPQLVNLTLNAVPPATTAPATSGTPTAAPN